MGDLRARSVMVAALGAASALGGCTPSSATTASSAPTASAAAAIFDDGHELIGRVAEPWHVEHWIHSQPLELAELAGRVVLVRFWTAPDCPFCSATAPALNEFHARYGARGLTVLGFYHHKSDTKLTPESVDRYAESFGFQFPIAIDPEWQTLKRWWLDGRRRDFTSASFLIDRSGVIRHVHPGGEYVKGDAAYAALNAKIDELLREAPPETAGRLPSLGR